MKIDEFIVWIITLLLLFLFFSVVYLIWSYITKILQFLIEKRTTTDTEIENLEEVLYKVDYMSGKEFENFIAQLFADLGFSVKKTFYVRDFGVDLLAKDKKGNLIAVQCKRSKNKVGVKAIQEIVAGGAFYKADELLVITNNFFTDSAIRLAKANHVLLVDRTFLKVLLILRSKGIKIKSLGESLKDKSNENKFFKVLNLDKDHKIYYLIEDD